MRLKNVNNDTPVGWKFKQPQILSQDIEAHSFRDLVRAVVKLRKSNPGISAQYQLSTDPAVVAVEVEEFVAARCMASGYEGFVNTGAPPSPFQYSPQQWTPLRGVAAVGAKISHVIAGIGVYVKWLGSGGRPVAPELAEARAATCVKCKRNEDRKGWLDQFTEPAAAEIKALLAIRSDMNLQTSLDEKLHICTACDCPLKTAIHAPLKHKLATMSDKTKASLPPHCWVLTEKP